MQFRPNGNPWGTHRVLTPKGALPQAAQRLDPSLPPFENELWLHVQALHLDSASFYALGQQGDSISDKVQDIVRLRGKMHNPITNSGGVLLGTIAAIGPKHPLVQEFSVGDKIVTLVSLTLTPLSLNKIQHVDEKGIVNVTGEAILFESGMAARLPEDFSQEVSLAAFDICGAPAQARRLLHGDERVLVLGLGKAGRAVAAQAELLGCSVYGIDVSEAAVSWCGKNLKGHFVTLNANDPQAVFRWSKEASAQQLMDFVFSTTNQENTEMSAILPCKEKGSILFFGMQTSFGKAVLGAEGIGKDVTLLMGNGYVPGHAEGMLELLRRHEPLRKWFEAGA